MRGKTPGLFMQVLGLGWYMALCIGGGVWGGVWLDGRLGTRPLFILLGLLLGLVLAFYGMYRMVLPWLSQTRDGQGKDS